VSQKISTYEGKLIINNIRLAHVKSKQREDHTGFENDQKESLRSRSE
jgi:hypothetical protein